MLEYPCLPLLAPETRHQLCEDYMLLVSGPVFHHCPTWPLLDSPPQGPRDCLRLNGELTTLGRLLQAPQERPDGLCFVLEELGEGYPLGYHVDFAQDSLLGCLQQGL